MKKKSRGRRVSSGSNWVIRQGGKTLSAMSRITGWSGSHDQQQSTREGDRRSPSRKGKLIEDEEEWGNEQVSTTQLS
jgi:hypothetical protein